MASRDESRLSHDVIIVRHEQFNLKDLMKLDEVVRLAVKKGIVKPKMREKLADNYVGFLGLLKKKPIDVFVTFLECLAETFDAYKEHRALVKIMTPDLLKIKAPPDLLSVVNGIVEAAKSKDVSTSGIVTHKTSISQTAFEEAPVIQTSLQEANLETTSKPHFVSQPSDLPSSSEVQVPVGDLERLSLTSTGTDPSQTTTKQDHPPKGYVKPPLSLYFTAEGGFFYSSAHGLEIEIPPGAILPQEGEKRIMVSMYAYMKGPFRIPAALDVEPCTAVFLLTVYPQRTFQNPVKLRVPHCAVVEDDTDCEEFVILRAPRPNNSESDVYEFTDMLEASYSEDGYHLETSVDQFSSFIGGRRRSSRRGKKSSQTDYSKKESPLRRSKRRKNSGKSIKPIALKFVGQTSSAASSEFSFSSDGSLDAGSSSEAPQSGQPEHTEAVHGASPIRPHRQDAFDQGRAHSPVAVGGGETLGTERGLELYMARWRPRRCVWHWEEVFLVACAHPTGRLALKTAMRNLDTEAGTDVLPAHTVVPVHLPAVTDCLEFIPDYWEGDGWEVMASRTPKIPIKQVTDPSEEEVRLSYRIKNARSEPMTELNFKVDVHGAEVGGAPLYFMLQSSPPQLCHPTTSAGSEQTYVQRLTIWSKLYTCDLIPAALQKGTESSVKLFPLSEDLHRLLAEVGFQLTDANCQALLPHLSLTEAGCERLKCSTEQSYWMLVGWVSSHPERSLSDFLSFLASTGVSGIDVISECNGKSIDCEFSAVDQLFCSLSQQNPEEEHKFFFRLACKLVKQWKFVGRFLGVAESDMDRIEQDYLCDSREQSFKLFETWQRGKACDATCEAVARVVYRLFTLDFMTVNDAWEFVKYTCHKLSQA